MKDNTFYFPHDMNAIQDPKMMLLLSSCGVGAIGIYWIIIEILHQQEDGKITAESFDKYIDFYCSFEHRGADYPSKIKQLLSKTNLLENDGTSVWSKRVEKNRKSRILLSEKRANAGRKGGLSKAIAKQSLAIAKQNVAKERKGNNIIDTYLSAFNLAFAREFKPTTGRIKKLNARLKTYTLQEIIQATKNMSKSPWHTGKNDRGWVADPDFLIRNDEQIDKFLNLKPKEEQKELPDINDAPSF